jgi:glucose-6-phosphate 1-epimerase
MTAEALNEQFGLDGVLTFEEHGQLTRARVTLPACEATVYVQGAHLTAWKPAGERDVLFLSKESEFLPGKAIRGGIPVCFPWFGGRSDGASGPSHGFARIEEWTLAFAALLPGAAGEDRVSLTWTLGPGELSRSLGFDGFRVAYEMLLGRSLTLRLTVANGQDTPLRFEEALHTYFRVGDVRRAPIAGLAGATYLDKRDDGKQKQAPEGPLQLDRFTDRVFPANEAAIAIEDEADGRKISVAKQGSRTTVVWNPWTEGAAALKDLGDEEWPEFLAVETANTATDALTLAQGETHTMVAEITVERDSAGGSR